MIMMGEDLDTISNKYYTASLSVWENYTMPNARSEAEDVSTTTGDDIFWYRGFSYSATSLFRNAISL